MSKSTLVRISLNLALLSSLAACGEDPVPYPTDGDESGAEADDGSDGASELDGGTKGRLDATVTPTSRDGGGRPDGGEKSAASAAPDATKPTTSRLRPKCVQKPTQVMVIGDSYINWISHTFPDQLIKETGQKWRMEAIGAYSMGSGGIGFIPDQYRQSIKKDPDCHTILMDGGGNDLLVADPNIDPFQDCKTDKAPTLPQCKKIIDTALAAADKLLGEASAGGIRDVVYFFYPHVPKGTLLGGSNPNAMLDYALPMVRDFCNGIEAKTSGKTRCHFIDMVPVFEGHDEWFIPGDIHPSSDGSGPMVKKVWEVMKAGCLGQPESSGCCEP
jgi:hypothetical protein